MHDSKFSTLFGYRDLGCYLIGLFVNLRIGMRSRRKNMGGVVI